jgi:hypothetical protein
VTIKIKPSQNEIERKLYQMTAFSARKAGRKPDGRNQKDARPPRQTKAQCQAAGDEMEAAGFTQIDWNKWSYGEFRIVPGTVDFRPGWVAICDDGRRIPIGTASAVEIKQRLDDEIAAITGVGELVDIDEWMLIGLPPTDPPANTRPGAEYGVIV